METSSGADSHHHQQPTAQEMLPAHTNGQAPTLQTSLSLAAAASSEQVDSPPDTQEPLYNSDGGHNSATDSASSRGTWPGEPSKSGASGPPMVAALITALRTADNEEEVVVGNGVSEQQAVSTALITLRDVAGDRVDLVAEKMRGMSEELLEEIKTQLRSIIEETSCPQQMELPYLQKLVQSRLDLTPRILSMAHPVQLEILVAIKTGIQEFLDPSVSIPQSRLAEIFMYKRCRNIYCQNPLPFEECRCHICSNRKGFCNMCMCVVCSMFDFEVNTCLWIGCDWCSHWTHTQCANHNGQIATGLSVRTSADHAEMLFRCQACQRTSEVLGWVWDVFQCCAPAWDMDVLLRELDYVCEIFRSSEDSKGSKLFRKCIELIETLRSGGSAKSTSPRILLQALQGKLCNDSEGKELFSKCSELIDRLMSDSMSGSGMVLQAFKGFRTTYLQQPKVKQAGGI